MTRSTTSETTADRRRRAAASANRAAGYCAMQDPTTGVHCTRRPHEGDTLHWNAYRGRETPTASHGYEWRD